MDVTRTQLSAWVRAAREGDRGAQGQLHAHAEPVVRGVLMARGGSVDIDDRVQDVFVLALSRLGQLADPSAFVPWILAIARRHDGRRHANGRVQPLMVDVPVVDSPRAEAERVLAKICALPESYAEPLTLRLVFGMSGAEIAETLGLSPAYVRVNLHRGMKRLRKSLGLNAQGHPTQAGVTTPGPADPSSHATRHASAQPWSAVPRAWSMGTRGPNKPGGDR